MAAKVRKLIAGLILSGIAAPVAAQQPPAPFPAAPMEEAIEIYYGTKRVNPEPMPEPSMVVPASAVEESPKAAQSFMDAMASVREGTREITSATVGLLGKVGERVKHTADTRPIVITTFSAPAQAAAAPQPQVVVVRESSEPRPVVEAAATVRLETLFLATLGLAAIGIAAWVGFNRTRKTMPLLNLTTAPLDPNSVSLMGKYNAGPKRDAAEKFDLGPTYHDELNQKKQVEEANNTAAVEFILNQNLALLAALNPDSEGAIAEIDGEGFAAPAMA